MLFGHQDDNTRTQQATAPTGVNPLAVDPDTGVSLPATPADTAPSPDDVIAPSTTEGPSVDTPRTTDTTPEPPAETADQTEKSTPTGGVAGDPSAPNDLIDLKQQALSQLGPLVDHLEMSPEERFRTTMMLIQSTDNQALIPKAYEAAQAIANEKDRAQALLDVVNEINYFTQRTNTGQS